MNDKIFIRMRGCKKDGMREWMQQKLLQGGASSIHSPPPVSVNQALFQRTRSGGSEL